MTPLISVIIPVYNTEKYLKQCVESVLGQSYQSFEMILIDDGSTDFSGKICDEYSNQDKRIQVIHKSNGGQSSARNKGLDLAKGKYIYFLDSDDYLFDTLLEKLVNTAEENNADVVFFEAQSFVDDEENKLYKNIEKYYEYIRKNEYEKCGTQKQLLKLYSNQEYFVCTPLHFYKKDYLDKNNIRFKEGIIHEDNLFCAMVYLNNGMSAHLSSRDYMRRLHTNSTMTLRDESHLLFRYQSLITVYKELVLLLNKTNPENEIKRILVNESFASVRSSYLRLSPNMQTKSKNTYCSTMVNMTIT